MSGVKVSLIKNRSIKESVSSQIPQYSLHVEIFARKGPSEIQIDRFFKVIIKRITPTTVPHDGNYPRKFL